MRTNDVQGLIRHLTNIRDCPDWLCFILVFSRFEYALKRSGYVRERGRGELKYAEADWEKFGKEVVYKLKIRECEGLSQGIKYLEENPPKRQVVKDGKLHWDHVNYGDGEVLRLVRAVKQVRNNLFHGCKQPSGPIADPSRDRILIEHSLSVLKCLLYSSDKVEKYYYEPLG